MLATLTMRKPDEAAMLAALVLESYPQFRVFALHGDLGAGKTTFIKGFCRALGVEDHTSSPSFSIVNEYRTASGDPIYHFDLYRLRSLRELLDIGFQEYVDSGHYCFIEWPEMAEGLLDVDLVDVRMSPGDHGTRIVGLAPRTCGQ
jgi:tRNA threonylcarbamoyladenosine biosynthesis protein TsaE